MGTFWPKKLSTNRKKAIEELVKGRDMATQLQILLQNPSGDHGSVSAEELVVEILRSFTETLSVMSSCESGEVCQMPATTQVGSPSCGDRRSVDSGESSKRPAVKDRRGSYKRRKSSSDSWIKVSPTMEDGYAWRKYGQKQILNAKFPRCYFRCTHKPDQGCLATKQVQRIPEDPPNMYQTKYFGHHTCSRDTTVLEEEEEEASQNILDSDPCFVESLLFSFGSKISSARQDHHLVSRPPVPPIKEECKEEAQSNLSGDLSAPVDSTIVWPDLMPLDSPSVYSSASTGSHGLEMDFLIESDDFHFDETPQLAQLL